MMTSVIDIFDTMIEPNDVLEEETLGDVLLNFTSRSTLKILVLTIYV